MSLSEVMVQADQHHVGAEYPWGCLDSHWCHQGGLAAHTVCNCLLHMIFHVLIEYSPLAFLALNKCTATTVLLATDEQWLGHHKSNQESSDCCDT